MQSLDGVQPETTEQLDDKSRGLVEQWVTEICLYEKQAETWHERAKKILRRYKDDRSPREGQVSRMNIFWSNVQTLLPSIYGQPPKPNVERRFKDEDKVGRYAADILERSVSYFVKEPTFNNSVKQAVFDYIVAGRGTVWARYVPHFRDMEVVGNEEIRDEGAEVTNDAELGDSDEVEPVQEVYYEEVILDYVNYEDFGHTIGRTPDEIRAYWRKVYLDKDELTERFGADKAEKTPLDYSPTNLNDSKISADLKKATIYEIWDKTTKKAIWLHKDLELPLDEIDDPLRLRGFFPCPKPMFANLANDSCIPTPDYTQYQDQAYEIDNLTSRISAMQKALKVAGVYDSSAKGIERLLSEGGENKLIPVDQWAAFGEKGGLKGVIEFLPIQEIANTIQILYQIRDKVKADLYEISGIADIMRGVSDPDETATAQTLKGQYSSIRLKDKQDEVRRFAKDAVVIMAEIIAEHFSIDTIKKVSGIHLLTNAEKQQAQNLLQRIAQPPAPQPMQNQQPPRPPMPPQQPPQGVPPMGGVR